KSIYVQNEQKRELFLQELERRVHIG
ncbi:NAD(P)-binding protein, partial [Bacillus anthracis]|nr:NAD(P)-binding protein [Bacillus anthracis]